MQAKKSHWCVGCKKEIQWQEYYYASSYKDMCEKCFEESKLDGQTEVPTLRCRFCNDPAIGVLYQIPTCRIHIGEAVTTV